MVDHSEMWTNQTYLIDFIPISISLRHISKGQIRRLYVEKNLSASQIAERYGVSKTFVLSVLHKSGLTEISKVGRSTHPQNYRNNSPPYGYTVRNGHLVTYNPELKICRIVVELRGRRNLSTTQVALELEKRGFKNRKGSKVWNTNTILNIFNRWNGKI